MLVNIKTLDTRPDSPTGFRGITPTMENQSGT